MQPPAVGLASLAQYRKNLMAKKRITDSDAVTKAIDEYDQIGQAKFLNRYRFGKSQKYILLHKNNRYDSKAIYGVAYGNQYGKPLTHEEFSGGMVLVVPTLEKLGFHVVASDITEISVALPEEVDETLWEGTKKSITINAYERNPEARAQCIAFHGSRCAICTLDLGEKYGDQFHGFIHVHHITALSQINERYKVNPQTDLIPVCPNCHAIIHYNKQIRSVKDVKSLIEKTSS